uniref:BEACH domain-containing protein n=2 Tax=Plectus sambesii TaxID=2011161 RepID=A0A914VXL7_9BILA
MLKMQRYRSSYWPENGSALKPASNLILLICFVFIQDTAYSVAFDDDIPTLRECSLFSPAVLTDNHVKLNFVVYQMLCAVQQCYARGFIPEVSLDVFRLDKNSWILLDVVDCVNKKCVTSQAEDIDGVGRSANGAQHVESVGGCGDEWRRRPLWQATEAWTERRISNLDYLLLLNEFAGRTRNNPDNHPIFPWVCDFSANNGGYRDLTKVKYRMNKGDQQLDQSYCSPAHLPPHHIPELLSDIGYFVYLARVQSQKDLCSHVRSQWVPEEYPSNMRRLYEWTPDECIPEFFEDPGVFTSLHSDMTDLAVPSWCQSTAEFIEWHRSVLESDHVSSQLHHWIDLAFGYKLTGEAAVSAKNVHLSLASKGSSVRRHGVVQLFTKEHPRRRTADESPRTNFSMGEAVDLAMNPLYEMSSRPSETFSAAAVGKPFELVSLARSISEKQNAATDEPLLERCLISFAVTLLELLLPVYFRSLPKNALLFDRLVRAQMIADAYINQIARSLRRALRVLLKLDKTESPLKHSQMSPDLLLQPLFTVFSFPHYFDQLHDCLRRYEDLKRQFRISFIAGHHDAHLVGLAESQVRLFAKHIPPLLPHMKLEAIKLVVAFLSDLLDSPWTRVLSAWSLFNPIAQFAGPELSDRLLRPALLRLYDVDEPCTQKMLKLYHRSFLLQLSVRLRTATFLREFVPPLVEAAAGERDSNVVTDDAYWRELSMPPSKRRPSRSVHLSHLSMSEDEERKRLRESPEIDELESRAVQFDLELGRCSKATGDGDDVSTTSQASRESVNRPMSPNNCPAEPMTVSTVAKESLIWLAHRLGPTLTARYVTTNLLRMLALCYSDENKLASTSGEEGIDADVNGDALAANIIECLVEIAAIYGNPFITMHYLPFCADLMQLATKRLNGAVEAGAIGCVVLLDACCPYLSDKQLMDSLQEPIVDGILFPAVRLASSLRFLFSDIQLRRLLAWKTAKTLHLLGCRVGGDNMKRHMAAPLQRLLCTYDVLYDRDADGKIRKKDSYVPRDETSPPIEALLEQLHATFTPQLACSLYRVFSGLCGRRYFQLSLSNADLIVGVAELGGCESSPTRGRSAVELGLGLASGNRLSGCELSSSFGDDATVASNFDRNNDAVLHQKLSPSERHLRGNWLAHWQHELGRDDKSNRLLLNQIPLCSFVGHTSAVRHMRVLDNENSFISSSQDKTVKLWSIRSSSSGMAKCDSQWTYKAHKKPINDVVFVESNRLIASTDGCLHLWDPFMGATLREYDWPATPGSDSSGGITCIRAFESPSRLLLAASTEATLRFLDLRMARWAHDMKVSSTAQSASVRCVATDAGGNWAAVGFSNGITSFVDVRTGRLIGSGRTTDTEISAMESSGSSTLVTAQPDHPLTVWNARNASLKHKITGSPDHLACMAVSGEQLICVSTSNKVRIYDDLAAKQGNTESRLRSDVFSGSVSSIAVLPINRLLLFGSNSGVIQLLC